ncbi:hypothetical protein HOY82DRAFT_111153 [Tuber indicum]|nr:hypothetical protein HOY82DRAFT_111153 [Tuber indicum]
MPDTTLYGIVGLMVVAGVLYLSYSRRTAPSFPLADRSRRTPVETAGTPPRSLTPNLASEKDARMEDIARPEDVSGYSLPQPNAPIPNRRKPSITALVTNLLPTSRRGSVASPFTSTTTDGEGGAFPPVVNRSKEEIESYGDFPDYAALTGVRLPAPYMEFDIKKALPRPYRPFRWAYHQTMSLTKMEPDWWLELENTYVDRIAQRKSLYAQHGKQVLDYLPGTEAACKELMEMCLEFLVARYPHYFTLKDRHTNPVFGNKILDKEFRIKEMHPLHVILENIPEDFAITLQDDQGFYSFRAGVICSSLGWNVGTKIGMKLHEIHKPIPDYKEKMQKSMDRYFTKMQTNKPIQRGSWGLEVGQPLFMPPGDPHEAYRSTQSPSLTLDDVNLRVDWQTLRRLPLSGAIVFNFKALFTPIQEFRDEPGVPQLVLKVLKEGKKNLMEYKNTWHVEHVALPALEKWSKEQTEEGLMPEGWEVSTLGESPWFRGWREKWHRQQGF